MPTTIIFGLAAVIAIGLLIVAWDLVTRPRRRRVIDADRAVRRSSELAAISGLAQVAAAQGWQGPMIEPVLSAPILPVLNRPGEPESPAGFAGNLTLHLHSVLNPSSRLRNLAQLSSEQTGPTVGPYDARLVNCYRAVVDGRELIVGNCFCTFTTTAEGGGYSGPLPDIGDIGSGFCAVRLRRMHPFPFQVIPRQKAPLDRGRTGYPALDGRYSVLTASPGLISRAILARSPLADLPQPPPGGVVGDQLAAFIARRDDWAFTVHVATLVCATFEPIRSGEQARQLVADAVAAAAMVGG